MTSLLKLTTVKNIMEECLPERQVFHISERAAAQMSNEIDGFVKRVVMKALRMAQHTGRVVVKAEDVVLAMEIIRASRYGDD